jgi:antitoxin component of MazEF toxin-antitoxin module
MLRKRGISMERLRVCSGEPGSISLPEAYLHALDVRPGDEVVVTLEENELHVVTRAEALRRIQKMVQRQIPAERSLSAELSRERREEAERA